MKRFLICVLLCVLMSASLAFSASAIEPDDYGYYDYNTDGVLELSDVLRVISAKLRDPSADFGLTRVLKVLKATVLSETVTAYIADIDYESGTAFVNTLYLEGAEVPLARLGLSAKSDCEEYINAPFTLTVRGNVSKFFENFGENSDILAAKVPVRSATDSAESVRIDTAVVDCDGDNVTLANGWVLPASVLGITAETLKADYIGIGTVLYIDCAENVFESEFASGTASIILSGSLPFSSVTNIGADTYVRYSSDANGAYFALGEDIFHTDKYLFDIKTLDGADGWQFLTSDEISEVLSSFTYSDTDGYVSENANSYCEMKYRVIPSSGEKPTVEILYAPYEFGQYITRELMYAPTGTAETFNIVGKYEDGYANIDGELTDFAEYFLGSGANVSAADVSEADGKASLEVALSGESVKSGDFMFYSYNPLDNVLTVAQNLGTVTSGRLTAANGVKETVRISATNYGFGFTGAYPAISAFDSEELSAIIYLLQPGEHNIRYLAYDGKIIYFANNYEYCYVPSDFAVVTTDSEIVASALGMLTADYKNALVGALSTENASFDGGLYVEDGYVKAAMLNTESGAWEVVNIGAVALDFAPAGSGKYDFAALVDLAAYASDTAAAPYPEEYIAAANLLTSENLFALSETADGVYTLADVDSVYYDGVYAVSRCANEDGLVFTDAGVTDAITNNAEVDAETVATTADTVTVIICGDYIDVRTGVRSPLDSFVCPVTYYSATPDLIVASLSGDGAETVIYENDFSDASTLSDFEQYRMVWEIRDGGLYLTDEMTAPEQDLATSFAHIIYKMDEPMADYIVEADYMNVQTAGGVIFRADADKVDDSNASSFYGYLAFMSNDATKGALGSANISGGWSGNLNVGKANSAIGANVHIKATVKGDYVKVEMTDIDSGNSIYSYGCTLGTSEYDNCWESGTVGFRMRAEYTDTSVSSVGTAYFDNLKITTAYYEEDKSIKVSADAAYGIDVSNVTKVYENTFDTEADIADFNQHLGIWKVKDGALYLAAATGAHSFILYEGEKELTELADYVLDVDMNNVQTMGGAIVRSRLDLVSETQHGYAGYIGYVTYAADRGAFSYATQSGSWGGNYAISDGVLSVGDDIHLQIAVKGDKIQYIITEQGSGSELWRSVRARQTWDYGSFGFRLYGREYSGTLLGNLNTTSFDNLVISTFPDGADAEIVPDTDTDTDTVTPTDSEVYIGDTRLTDCSVVISADAKYYEEAAAKEIISAVKATYGVELPLITDAEEERIGEIVVGDTEREVSALVGTESGESEITVSGNSVAVGGADALSLYRSSEYFTYNYVTDTEAKTMIASNSERGELMRNPVRATYAGDPHITYDEETGYYYAIYSAPKNDRVILYRVKNLSELGSAEGKEIYVAGEDKEIKHKLFAPEIHKVDGKWYIYASGATSTADAGASASPSIRLFCLEAVSDDPYGEYEFKGFLNDTLWAIDAHIFSYGGETYVSAAKIGGGNSICVARLENAWTLDESTLTVISAATYDWELMSGKVNEGPFAFTSPSGKLFMLYSANNVTSGYYCLGMLEFTGDDILSAESWTKSETPVFSGTDLVDSPGHCSVFTSPDGAEYWLAYHFYSWDTGSRQRALGTQSFTFDENGYPVFGTPLSSEELYFAPGGE